jgi:hypothetical protein
MRIVYFFFLVFGFISCEKKNKTFLKKYHPYIISEERRKYKIQDELYKKGEIDKVLLMNLPKYLYGTENFILDDSSNVYYYQLERYFSAVGCGTDMEKDSIPFFLDIKPESFIKLSISSIDDFVKQNMRSGERNLVKIASQNDTLNSKAYFKLQEALNKYLNFREDRDIYLVYPTTQEEDTVLNYKKYKKNYESDSIKWDKKKIRFFTKSKIDE